MSILKYIGNLKKHFIGYIIFLLMTKIYSLFPKYLLLETPPLSQPLLISFCPLGYLFRIHVNELFIYTFRSQLHTTRMPSGMVLPIYLPTSSLCIILNSLHKFDTHLWTLAKQAVKMPLLVDRQSP